ncbi:hypothetical protein M514_24384 [Trichuris suis]|uniref:Uncharacterized protein n=1 Tax=Trichuris suis TaxID=68888 RepID=A0A085N1W2_9BILA|nr:hypothetical protein M514_24384 [Trichuris suis]
MFIRLLEKRAACSATADALSARSIAIDGSRPICCTYKQNVKKGVCPVFFLFDSEDNLVGKDAI